MLLDTTVLVDHLRDNPAIRARVDGLRDTPLASVITVEELLAGLKPGREAKIERLIAGLALVPVGEPEARLAASWRRTFAERGVTLQRWDTLIAACAATAGVPLVTANVRHFPMEEVTVVHWPSE